MVKVTVHLQQQIILRLHQVIVDDEVRDPVIKNQQVQI